MGAGAPPPAFSSGRFIWRDLRLARSSPGTGVAWRIPSSGSPGACVPQPGGWSLAPATGGGGPLTAPSGPRSARCV
eukprot:6422897-Alexandrium_andersonii.AAC.1